MTFHYQFFYTTPLHIAVEKQNVEMIKLLLEQKGIDLNILDNVFICSI